MLAIKDLVQRGVWRQAGRCLVRHFAGIWEFASRPSLSETPPERQAPDTVPDTPFSFTVHRSPFTVHREPKIN